MSDEKSLSLSFTEGTDFDKRPFARLYQKPFNRKETADFGDLNRMMSYGIAGLSAFNAVEKVCPYLVYIDEKTAEMRLPFYIVVSSLDLPFQLIAGEVEDKDLCPLPDDVKELKVTTESVDYDIVVSGRGITLPWIFEGEVTPVTPAINGDGDEVDVNYTVDGAYLLCDVDDTWAVVNLRGVARLYSAELVRRFTAQPHTEITEIKVQIGLVYFVDGVSRRQVLDIKVPDCVYAGLDTCEDPNGGGTKWRRDIRTWTTRVFYHACTGDMLKICIEENE